MLLVVAAAALVALVLTTAIPARTRFLGLLNNAGHAPIFGAFAWLVWRLLLRRPGADAGSAGPYLAAFGVTLVAGAAVEGLQSLVGRDASLFDLLMDAAGAASVLCLAAAWTARRGRWPLRAGLLAGAALAATVVLAPLVEGALAYARRAGQFPVIASFERRLDLYFLEGGGSALERIALPEPWAQGAAVNTLAVRLEHAHSPGLRHNEPAADWRGYQALKLDLINPGETPLRFVLRVHDAAHDQRHIDRFNRSFTLQPRSRRVLQVPLEDIASAPRDRRLDLSQVAGLVLFERSRPAPVGASFYVTRIWLE